MYDAGGRVELSGATVLNWVSKSANLLAESEALPCGIGVALPLHWQAVTLVLAAGVVGERVVLADSTAGLAGCGVAVVDAKTAGAMDQTSMEVVALSLHPLGLPGPPAPIGFVDFNREVLGHADDYLGAVPGELVVEQGGKRIVPVTAGLSTSDRVLTTLRPTQSPDVALLGPLQAGAGLVLVPDPASADLAAIAAAEHVTATAGCDVAGVRRLV